MNHLRKYIRKIILEGDVKNSFENEWYDDEITQFTDADDAGLGTHHKDNLKGLYVKGTQDDEIEELFKNKRDLKRMWNEFIDKYDLRDFWEGPKMKYYHSLTYYGGTYDAVNTISYSEDSDEYIKDLTATGFFQLYKKSGNKDEMSTYGIYDGKIEKIPVHQKSFGVIISGRVTLATTDDAFTESRSKATPVDIATYRGSGMPKRIMPTNKNVDSLLFEEEDILYEGGIGECVLDNWSVEAIVYNPKSRSGAFVEKAAAKIAEQYGVPLLTAQSVLNAK